MAFSLDKKTRLSVTIAISFLFFIAEIIVAFRAGSLALLADAFHYLNDLVSFIVALSAEIISEKATARQDLSFGWQRARLIGAFFNGVFLLALGISVLLQSIERFINIQPINDPFLVMIIGCTGLGLNILSAAFVHEHPGHDHSHGHGHGHDHGHDHEHAQGHETEHPNVGSLVNLEMGASNDQSTVHSHAEHRHHSAKLNKPGRDLGMLGVLIHVVGDAINNIGVIVAAVIIWQTSFPERFYADPAASTFIALMIFGSAIPLTLNSGKILLQSAPRGVEIDDVKHDLEQIPGIDSVHELHIWRLDQQKAIASAHIVLSDEESMATFTEKARVVNQCLHAYGIHSATLQPEAAPVVPASAGDVTATDGAASVSSSLRRRRLDPACQIICSSLCQNLTCCAKIEN
ncbi:hypothetical protein N0V82_008812 [Gnomoniopsis sp. IMI 355080]|nr:hypothetical protein N0V82_008812 [Gnomoniopsis sp. IMI 355080]